MLAKVLGVPPILLIMPLGKEPTVELLPGCPTPTWAATKWWSGDGCFPTRSADGRWVHSAEDRKDWETGAVALRYFHDHDVRVRDVQEARAMLDPAAHQQAGWTETRLRDLRENMRRAGILPPDLPDDLANIDSRVPGNG